MIVGGGITGLAAAEQLSRSGGIGRMTLLEGSDRFGGHIRTERSDGFIVECGPDVLLSSKPAATELARRVGLGDRIIGTNPAAKGAFVLTRNGLARIPEGMTGLVPSDWRPFAATPLLSPLGKLRVAYEYLVPPKRDDVDESVEAFVVRRLGREMYDRLAQPLLSGISAGDGARLSMSAMFPQLVAMERKHGGLIRGMFATRRSRRQAANGLLPFLSFEAGLGQLVEATIATIRARDSFEESVTLRTGAQVGAISRGAGGLTLQLQSGESLSADAVIVTTAAYSAADQLRDMDPVLAADLAGIEYSSTATISVAYRAASVKRLLNGTGYVVPRILNRPVLACTWSAAKFAGRAPDGFSLFRVFIGGSERDTFAAADDAEIREIVKREMRDVMGIADAPVFERIDRYVRAMPQYHVAHLERVARIRARTAQIPGLYLAGAAYDGMGIPDCVKSGVTAAVVVEANLRNRSQEPATITG